MNSLLRFLSFAIACGMCGSALAADETVLQLIDNPQVSGNVLRLGDLVQIRNAQGTAIEKLLKMPMGPAPQGSEVQTWTQAEVFRHLELRGIHKDSVRWTGSQSTRLSAVSKSLTPTRQMVPAFVENRMTTQSQTILSAAISDYVQYQTGEIVDWQIDEISFPVQYTKTLQSRRNIVGIGGGKSPWEGKQAFTIEINDKSQSVQINVSARLKLPPMVVVAKRPIRREEILKPEALTYSTAPRRSTNPDADYFTDISELVGKQARRSISTGLAITGSYVGAPILVRRNALLQLESVAGSIVVRTQAKAIGSGAAGDLIEVQTLDTRQKLYATIIDSLTVRIAAHPTRKVR